MCACGRMGDFLCVCACVWVCVYAVHIFYFCLTRHTTALRSCEQTTKVKVSKLIFCPNEA